MALVVSVSQAVIAWRGLNRALESTLLQQQITQCTTVISLVQDFGNRNAEYRLSGAIRAEKAIQGVPGIDLNERQSGPVSDELFNKQFQASADAGFKAMDYLNTVRHLYDRKMRAQLSQTSSLISEMVDRENGLDGSRALKFAELLRSIMSNCDRYGREYGL
ncbi:MAG TPA: hypothetical protein VFB31_00865 [Pseudolabrys sp.]|nr:hypothetical protein [Pseudolabrys sp.]